MSVQVPAIYQQYVAQAAQATGLPQAVVAAQIQYESSFNPNAVSPTGAQGIAQFEPGTWSSYGTGSPFNVGDAFAAYSKYMKTLLDQFHGNVTDALEAYNAGPGDLSAGAGYAQHILSVAGSPGGIQITSDGSGANTGTNASPTGFDLPGFLNKAFQWLTQDPISGLLGNGGLAGSLASGIEQGVMRGFLDILVQVWQKVVKPVFWVFELGAGLIIMAVSLAILTSQTKTGGRLMDLAALAPGPWGMVAKGASATMGGRIARPQRGYLLDGGGRKTSAPSESGSRPERETPAPARPVKGNNQRKRRVYSGHEEEETPAPSSTPSSRAVTRRRPATTKKRYYQTSTKPESYDDRPTL